MPTTETHICIAGCAVVYMWKQEAKREQSVSHPNWISRVRAFFADYRPMSPGLAACLCSTRNLQFECRPHRVTDHADIQHHIYTTPCRSREYWRPSFAAYFPIQAIMAWTISACHGPSPDPKHIYLKTYTTVRVGIDMLSRRLSS